MDPSSSDAAFTKERELTLNPNICGNGQSVRDAPVDEQSTPWADAGKEIVIGSVAGMASEVLEYPFDLAKVRLQAQVLAPAAPGVPHFRGPLDCLTQTFKQEGVLGMYRGLAAPIAGSMAVTAALFLSYSSFQNVLRSVSHQRPNDTLSFTQVGIAAAGSGAVASFVITPIELVKCKMQVQMMNFPSQKSKTLPPVPGRIPHRLPPLGTWSPSVSDPLTRPPHAKLHNAAFAVKSLPTAPPGSIALIRSIVEAHGVRGLWLGHTGTMFREIGGCAAWFMVKEYVTRMLVDRRTLSGAGKKEMQPLAWESAVSGALAGAAGAVILYPADTVKSAIQTAEEMSMSVKSVGAKSILDEGVTRKGVAAMRKVGIGTGGFWSTFLQMYRVHGVKGLYAGCGMTVVRAIPSSGVIFVVYDGLNNWFS